MTALFQIEIVYALPHCQVLKKLDVLAGCTIEQAILRCGILDQFPEIDLTRNRLGIFGKFAPPDAILHPYDRVEIYRPLVIEPKDVRRIRARTKKGIKE